MSCESVSKARMQGTHQMNILLDPLENKSLIKKTSVQITISFDFLAGEKAPWTDAVVEINHDHIVISSLDQASAVEIRAGI